MDGMARKIPYEYFPPNKELAPQIGPHLTPGSTVAATRAQAFIETMRKHGYTCRDQNLAPIGHITDEVERLCFANENMSAADVVRLLFVDQSPFNELGKKLAQANAQSYALTVRGDKGGARDVPIARNSVGLSYLHCTWKSVYCSIRTFIETDDGLALLQEAARRLTPTHTPEVDEYWLGCEITMAGTGTVEGAGSVQAIGSGLLPTPRMFAPVAIFFPEVPLLVAEDMNHMGSNPIEDQQRFAQAARKFIELMHGRGSRVAAIDGFPDGGKWFYTRHVIIASGKLDLDALMRSRHGTASVERQLVPRIGGQRTHRVESTVSTVPTASTVPTVSDEPTVTVHVAPAVAAAMAAARAASAASAASAAATAAARMGSQQASQAVGPHTGRRSGRATNAVRPNDATPVAPTRVGRADVTSEARVDRVLEAGDVLSERADSVAGAGTFASRLQSAADSMPSARGAADAEVKSTNDRGTVAITRNVFPPSRHEQHEPQEHIVLATKPPSSATWLEPLRAHEMSMSSALEQFAGTDIPPTLKEALRNVLEENVAKMINRREHDFKQLAVIENQLLASEPSFTIQARLNGANEAVSRESASFQHVKWTGTDDLCVAIIQPFRPKDRTPPADESVQMKYGANRDTDQYVAVYAAIGHVAVAETLFLDYSLWKTAYDNAMYTGCVPVSVPSDVIDSPWGTHPVASLSYAVAILQARAMQLLYDVSRSSGWSRYRTSRALVRRMDFANRLALGVFRDKKSDEYVQENTMTNLVARASNCITLLAFRAHQIALRTKLAADAAGGPVQSFDGDLDTRDIRIAVRATCYAYACYVYRERIAAVFRASWFNRADGPMNRGHVIAAFLGDECNARVLELAVFGADVTATMRARVANPYAFPTDSARYRTLEDIRNLERDIYDLAFGKSGRVPGECAFDGVKFHVALLDVFSRVVYIPVESSGVPWRYPLNEVLLQPAVEIGAGEMRQCAVSEQTGGQVPCCLPIVLPTTGKVDMATLSNTDVQTLDAPGNVWVPPIDRMFSVTRESYIRPNAEDEAELIERFQEARRDESLGYGQCATLAIDRRFGATRDAYMPVINHAALVFRRSERVPENGTVTVISNGSVYKRVSGIAPFVSIFYASEDKEAHAYYRLAGVVTFNTQNRWSCNTGLPEKSGVSWYNDAGEVLTSGVGAMSPDDYCNPTAHTDDGRIFFYRRIWEKGEHKPLQLTAVDPWTGDKAPTQGVFYVLADRAHTEAATNFKANFATVHVGPIDHRHSASVCAGEVAHMCAEFGDPAKPLCTLLRKPVDTRVEGFANTHNVFLCTQCIPKDASARARVVSAKQPASLAASELGRHGMDSFRRELHGKKQRTDPSDN